MNILFPFTGNASTRRLSSAGSKEESHFLRASMDSFDSMFPERRGSGEPTMSPYFLKSMTPSTFESALRQKDGEIASYVSRLVSISVPLLFFHGVNMLLVLLVQHDASFFRRCQVGSPHVHFDTKPCDGNFKK